MEQSVMRNLPIKEKNLLVQGILHCDTLRSECNKLKRSFGFGILRSR